MITVGPWLAGRIVNSHRRITAQLEARNNELEAERERLAAESVRYERARIARELHDIVAHCLSLIVVQAGAGQRLALVGGLVRRAAATGLAVTCRLAGDHGRLPPGASDVAYRVVQEALTNALKHAPGAPVDVWPSARRPAR